MLKFEDKYLRYLIFWDHFKKDGFDIGALNVYPDYFTTASN